MARKRNVRGHNRVEPDWTKPYQVINIRTKKSHGEYETLDEARGAVLYDRIADWEIWHNRTSLVAYKDSGR